jgi:hypothetical protein
MGEKEERGMEKGEGEKIVVVGGKREGVDGGSGKERDRWLAEVERVYTVIFLLSLRA